MITYTVKGTVKVKDTVWLVLLIPGIFPRSLASGIPFDLGHFYGDLTIVKLPSLGYAASDL